jgi:chorismate mutase
MTIEDWRNKIDDLDMRLVELLNERARAAQEIGKLKRDTEMPIREPERERKILERICKANHGPFPDEELCRLYEHIMSVMRGLQRTDNRPAGEASNGLE